MKRRYNSTFIRTISKIKKIMPNTGIGVDVIVGLTETHDMFLIHTIS